MKQHSGERPRSYCSPNVCRVVKTRNMGRAGMWHVWGRKIEVQDFEGTPNILEILDVDGWLAFQWMFKEWNLREWDVLSGSEYEQNVGW